MAKRQSLSQKEKAKARNVQKTARGKLAKSKTTDSQGKNVDVVQRTAKGKLAKDKKTGLKGKNVNAMQQTANGTIVKMKGQKKVCRLNHLSLKFTASYQLF
jgi:hypothetical protein